MTYTLTLNATPILTADTLPALWHGVLRLCGHMTLAAFTERGYAIEVQHD